MNTTQLDPLQEAVASTKALFEATLNALRKRFQSLDTQNQVLFIGRIMALLPNSPGTSEASKWSAFDKERARFIRERADLDQNTLAQKVELSSKSIQRYESGDSLPVWNRTTKKYFEWLEKHGYFEDSTAI